MEIQMIDDEEKNAITKEDMARAMRVVGPVAAMLGVSPEATAEMLRKTMRTHYCSVNKASFSLRHVLVVMANHMEDK